MEMVSTGILVSPSKYVRFSHEAIAKNGGSTPAYDFNSFGHIMAAKPDVAAAQLSKTLPIQDGAAAGGFVIHGGGQAPISFDRIPNLPISEIDKILNGEASLYLFGTLSYLDTFGYKRRTDYCYVLDSEPFRDAWLQSVGNPETKLPIFWTITPFHNTAT